MKKNNNTDFSLKNVGENIEVYGWVQRKRDLGGLVFIDLRDRSGLLQLVINPEKDIYELAQSLKSEYVIRAKGEVVKRQEPNKKIATGEIEIAVDELEVLNKSSEIPFMIEDNTTALEETRLKYRYLDLRRTVMQNNLKIRHQIMMTVRNFLNDENFLEIETPILCKSTPEGSRDYLVPSRISRGKFYALPQSPQLFKQLLMVGGMERYFQIAKCFRDEDLRSDRQPEFTQIDMEMSFVDENDVMDISERLLARIFKEVKDIDIELPLQKMKYDDAMKDYGSDKPDIRFDMKIKDLTEIFKNTEFKLFKDVISNKGIINGIVVKGEALNFSRKKLDELADFVKTYKASGLFNLKFMAEVSGSIKKNVTDDELEEIKQVCGIEDNDLLLIAAGDYKIVKVSLGALRSKLGSDLNLYNKEEYAPLWIVDFPAFEYSEEEQRYVACHHPFTAPLDSDIDKLIDDKEHCYSKAYDIVINGYEAGGGSIRIHDSLVQKKMFDALELTEEDIEEKFGFFVNALKYGTPPHGGLAFGLDRLTMLLAGTENIKEVIAFPKTTSASDLMSESPSIVLDNQLADLAIKIDD